MYQFQLLLINIINGHQNGVPFYFRYLQVLAPKHELRLPKLH